MSFRRPAVCPGRTVPGPDRRPDRARAAL